VESVVASVEVYVDWLWRFYDVGLEALASYAVLRDRPAEYDQSVFGDFSEEFEALLRSRDGVLDVFACGV